MKRAIVVSGIAAGLFLSPSLALAATPTAAPPTTPVEKSTITVSPGKGVPGAEVLVKANCADGGFYPSSPALELAKDGFYPDGTLHYGGKVKDVKPGTYKVNLRCVKDGHASSVSTTFQVLPEPGAAKPPKQVVKVPTGAPQTGGTDGPQDTDSPFLPAAAGMGALAVGGAGLVLFRRRNVQN
jgi:hypothetical protein